MQATTSTCSLLAIALVASTGCGVVLDFDDYQATGGSSPQSSSSASGGGAGGGAGGVANPGFLSCSDPMRLGTGNHCGASQDDNCCDSLAVPGGTYQRSYNYCLGTGDQVATVSGFSLDKYEVTVGRFRAFLDAYQGQAPSEGAGAHPKIDGTGWQSNWPLPSATDLRNMVSPSNECWDGDQTWTDTPGTLVDETRPIACVTWYAAFLFCLWDGGRLPTEAEWNYVAAGGDEHRPWPWGANSPDSTLAVYYCSTPDWDFPNECLQSVGSKPSGAGKWGHLDLAGSVAEWCFDWSPFVSSECYYPNTPCNDCAYLSNDHGTRITRGGDYSDDSTYISSEARQPRYPDDHIPWRGFRCARDPLP